MLSPAYLSLLLADVLPPPSSTGFAFSLAFSFHPAALFSVYLFFSAPQLLLVVLVLFL
jgi:hypothetical protein